jgi:hypothetical protein
VMNQGWCGQLGESGMHQVGMLKEHILFLSKLWQVFCRFISRRCENYMSDVYMHKKLTNLTIQRDTPCCVVELDIKPNACLKEHIPRLSG